MAVVRKSAFHWAAKAAAMPQRSAHTTAGTLLLIISSMCRFFARKGKSLSRNTNRRGYAAAQMASTALPHTKNCRSEYRSGNSVFLCCDAFSTSAPVIESPATMTSAATPASPVEGVPAEEAGAPDEAAGASEDVVGASDDSVGASDDSSAVLPSLIDSSLTVYSAPPVAYSEIAVMVILPSAGV
ncbi:MAG: hypothetical protein ACLUFV_01295 [Acutalibacteraceae bacterium]